MLCSAHTVLCRVAMYVRLLPLLRHHIHHPDTSSTINPVSNRRWHHLSSPQNWYTSRLAHPTWLLNHQSCSVRRGFNLQFMRPHDLAGTARWNGGVQDGYDAGIRSAYFNAATHTSYGSASGVRNGMSTLSRKMGFNLINHLHSSPSSESYETTQLHTMLWHHPLGELTQGKAKRGKQRKRLRDCVCVSS